jgi:phage baseplate assembly protein W
MVTYRGFNTINQVKKFRLTDLDLVKRNLLNHFMIRKGEKLMQPNFGSIIWNILFEPLTEETKKVILDDVTTIVGYDPRIAVDEVIIQELGNGLQLQIALTYKPGNTTTSMTLAFDKNSQTLTMS